MKHIVFRIISFVVCFFVAFFFNTSLTAACVESKDDDEVDSHPIPSSIIRADEIANLRTLRARSHILGANLDYGRFIEQVEGNLVCKAFSLDVVGSIATPVVAGKILYDATVISERFVRLTFGIASERTQKIQTEDTNHDEYYTDKEYLIWDLTPDDRPATFKVESPNFTSVYLVLNDLNNPERVLTNEKGYTVEGDTKDSGRYRFYNLLDRSFHEAVIFDFSPISTTFYTVNDKVR